MQQPKDIKQSFVDYCYDLQSRIADLAASYEPNAASPSIQEQKQEDGSLAGRKVFWQGEGDVLASVAVNVTSRPLKSPLEPTSTLVGGISIILHGNHPFVPSIHMNFRMFDDTEKGILISGVQDLNPMIEVEEDTTLYHEGLKSICDEYSAGCYTLLKEHCDRYFYNRFVGAPRGVGGIFFEDMNSGDAEKDLNFVKAIGDYFLSFYGACIERRKDMEFTDADVKAQLEKRSLYVLYNLLIDRGTVWGMMSPNVDPIHVLASFPPTFIWAEDILPEIKKRVGEGNMKLLALIEQIVVRTKLYNPAEPQDEELSNITKRELATLIANYYLRYPEKLPKKEDVIPGAVAKAQTASWPEEKRLKLEAALNDFPGYVPAKLVA